MTKPRNFWKDWIAISFAVTGMILMVLTMAWRINPVEGSVVPDFFHSNPIGQVLFWILLITSMPVFILTGSLPIHFPGNEQTQRTLMCAAMAAIQGLQYFLIGKGASSGIRRLRRKRQPSRP